jgi:hypothetical protein
MTTSDLLITRNFPTQPVRQGQVKTCVGWYEEDQGSPWWAFHRPANETFERNLVVASAYLLTSTFKRLG